MTKSRGILSPRHIWTAEQVALLRELYPHHQTANLEPIYRWLRKPAQRLRKSGIERLKDGSIGKNPQRMGPLTFEARLTALEQVIAIQEEINGAAPIGSKPFDLINQEEEARIRELISAETWPNGWNGNEPHADEFQSVVYYENGAEQHDLFGLEEL